MSEQTAKARMQATVSRYEKIIRDNLENIQEWRSQGFSAEQIAFKLDLPSRSTLYMFLNRMNELKVAWNYADTTLLQDFIEPKLRERADKGFHYIEEVEELLRDSDGHPIPDAEGNVQYVVTKRIHKVSPCNNTLHLLAAQLNKKRWGSKNEDVTESSDLEIAEDIKEYSE